MATAAQTSQLYNEVVEVTKEYLGPAAQRFIDRQVTSHLNKQPHEITHNDLVMLVDWSRAAMSLLTDDTHIVNDFVENLMRLAKKVR